ncbi:MAG TPA: carbohydrate ABC transporter permease [Thermomicrobiales bacterium]|nr:carbohydrate ABC transporter permease [Thermomicrobiales bacterium]
MATSLPTSSSLDPGNPPQPRSFRSAWLYGPALLWLLAAGLPFAFVVLSSFKSVKEYIADLWAMPASLQLSNYLEAVEGGIGRFFINSLIVTVSSVVLTLVLASLASFPLAKMKFRLNRPLFLLFIAGAMIPVHVTLIPIYTLTNRLGIYDTLLALIGPYIAFHLPLAVLIITEFMSHLPAELEEAARIDGAGPFEVFRRIILPLSTPALSTVAIYTFIYAWNEFVFALVLLSSRSNMTLPLGLMQFSGEYSVNVPGIMAAVTLASLPIILFYLVMQERVVAGMVAGAVKG